MPVLDDSRVRMDRMIAVEIQAEKSGNRLLGLFGMYNKMSSRYSSSPKNAAICFRVARPSRALGSVSSTSYLTANFRSGVFPYTESSNRRCTSARRCATHSSRPTALTRVVDQGVWKFVRRNLCLVVVGIGWFLGSRIEEPTANRIATIWIRSMIHSSNPMFIEDVPVRKCQFTEPRVDLDFVHVY